MGTLLQIIYKFQRKHSYLPYSNKCWVSNKLHPSIKAAPFNNQIGLAPSSHKNPPLLGATPQNGVRNKNLIKTLL